MENTLHSALTTIASSDGPGNPNDVTHPTPSATADNRNYILAVGQNMQDKEFVNYALTKNQWISNLRSAVRVGKKDGRCLLQGRLVHQSSRKAKNMIENSILMLDIDVGMSQDAIEELLQKAKLGAVIWSTHSHLSDQSYIPERALISWAKKKNITIASDDDQTLKSAVAYLREVKGYLPDVLEGATYSGRIARDGGLVFAIRHKPIPKFRVMFFLKDRFSFSKDASGNPQSQDERIALWTEGYASVAKAIGIPYDKSCVDPARLMFTPRRPKEESPYVFEVIPGEDLDFDHYLSLADKPGLHGPNASGSRVDQGAKDRRATRHDPDEFKTPGLVKFVATHPDFDAVSWAESLNPDDRREGGPASGGANWTCPNADNHSDGGKPEDTAFAIFQPNDGQGQWGMSCLHQTCIAMSNNDRVWFLDQLCQKYQVGVESMGPFSATWTDGEQRRQDRMEREEENRLRAENKEFVALIDALTPGPSNEQLQSIFDILMHANSIEQECSLIAISQRADIPKTTLRTMFSRYKTDRKRQMKSLQQAAREAKTTPPPPKDDFSGSSIVDGSWDWKTQTRAAIGIFKDRNGADPRVFRNVSGGRRHNLGYW